MKNPGGGRKLQTRSAAKRAQILKAAAQMFLESGFDAVSVDMVVARVGGTKTNIYKHFGDKAGLFAAVVEELWSESVKPFAEVEALAVDELPLEEALRQLARNFLLAICTDHEIKLHRLVVAEAARHPSLAGRWYGIGPEEAYARFAAYIDKQQRAGRLISMPARRLAPLFVDMCSQEMHLRMMVAGEPPPKRSEIDRVVNDSVQVFLHGALAKPETAPAKRTRRKASVG